MKGSKGTGGYSSVCRKKVLLQPYRKMYTLEGKRKKQTYLLKAGTEMFILSLLWIFFFESDGPIDFHLHFEAHEKQIASDVFM